MVVIASLFERRAQRALPQHGGGHRRRRLAARASTARCTSRTIRSTTRNSISRPGDTGFRAWNTTLRQDRRAHLLGPVVSRGGAADGAPGRGDHLLPDGDRLAPAGEGAARGATSTTPGRPSSAPTPSPTAASSRSCNRIGRERPAGGAGIEFWGQSFVAGTSGEILARAVGGRGGGPASSPVDLGAG